jgi:tetratricopeptide (TPR) repeat protein
MDMADFRHLKSTAEKAMADAESLQSEALLAEALLYDSIASRRLGDATTALAAAQRGLMIIADSNALLRARLLTAVGNAYGQRGDSDQEIRAKTEALHVARAAEDQRDLAGALTNLANIMLGRGDFEQAAAYYREAIEVATKIEDLQGEGLVKFNLASLLRAKGNLSGARDLLEQSERLYRTVHNDLRAERANHELAVILLETGQVTDSHNRLVASRAAMERAGGGDDLPGVMLSLGDTLAAEGDLKAASDQYEQASAICTKRQSAECTAAYQVSVASLLVVEGQFEKAAALAAAAAETYRTGQSPDGEVDARASLATALLGQNLPQQALAEVEKA